MNRILLLIFAVGCFSCRKYIKHERYINNGSSDTVWVKNPDFDTLYLIPSGGKAMIYSYEMLDEDFETDTCAWGGDTLFIYNTAGDTCHKSVKLEGNWTSVTTPDGKRDHRKVCTFTLTDDDF